MCQDPWGNGQGWGEREEEGAKMGKMWILPVYSPRTVQGLRYLGHGPHEEKVYVHLRGTR